MSQHSEELAEAAAAQPTRTGARILPFERPQSDLQRAIQQRAQEALDRDRALDAEKRRPRPLKWLAIFAVASIPVLLLFAAVDGFLRVFYKVTETYSSAPPAEAVPTAPQPDLSQPGVIFLEPYDARTQPNGIVREAEKQPEQAPPPR